MCQTTKIVCDEYDPDNSDRIDQSRIYASRI